MPRNTRTPRPPQSQVSRLSTDQARRQLARSFVEQMYRDQDNGRAQFDSTYVPVESLAAEDMTYPVSYTNVALDAFDIEPGISLEQATEQGPAQATVEDSCYRIRMTYREPITTNSRNAGLSWNQRYVQDHVAQSTAGKYVNENNWPELEACVPGDGLCSYIAAAIDKVVLGLVREHGYAYVYNSFNHNPEYPYIATVRIGLEKMRRLVMQNNPDLTQETMLSFVERQAQIYFSDHRSFGIIGYALVRV